jgi:hypothetical protein
MNDEMVMRGGVERSANPNIKRMLNVFDLHFSTPINTTGRVILRKNVSALFILFEGGEGPLQFEFTNIATK